jgi:hypothetical protein
MVWSLERYLEDWSFETFELFKIDYQGDQIGRIFAYLIDDYFRWTVFCKLQKLPKYLGYCL